MNTTEVADLLKGPRGTQVKIGISREGAKDDLTFTVTRDEISRKSVPEAFWIQPGIAYIKILQFGENTGKELDDTLKRLGENNIHGLVLDLRGNPGGLLNSGVAVADHFLQRGQLIVSHHGRSSPERTYIARNGNHGHDYPMVVLVDRQSASAAEIVSGRLAGPRPRLDSGRNHFRQGPGADGLSAQRPHRAGAHHGAFLHAQRAAHPARLQPRFLLRLLHPPRRCRAQSTRT